VRSSDCLALSHSYTCTFSCTHTHTHICTQDTLKRMSIQKALAVPDLRFLNCSRVSHLKVRGFWQLISVEPICECACVCVCVCVFVCNLHEQMCMCGSFISILELNVPSTAPAPLGINAPMHSFCNHVLIAKNGSGFGSREKRV
jgi:hypothetical protein